MKTKRGRLKKNITKQSPKASLPFVSSPFKPTTIIPLLLTKQLPILNQLLTYKISNKCAVKVRDLLHTSRDVPWSWGTTGITVGLFFVVIVTQDKAEQKTRHHNISDPQHREVAACGTGEQLKLGLCPVRRVTRSRHLHFVFELCFFCAG